MLYCRSKLNLTYQKAPSPPDSTYTPKYSKNPQSTKVYDTSTKFDKSIGLKNNNTVDNIDFELTEAQLKQLNFKKQLAQDINHPRIREMIFNHPNISSIVNKSPATHSRTSSGNFDHISSRQHQQQFKNNLVDLQLMEQRRWLTRKGKKYLIDFDEKERRQMKFCFNSMDVKKQGSIGIDELEELLLSVGLMETREEVKELIDKVDEDKSGKIQFSEFLKMIQNDQGENQEIVAFFKHIISNNRSKFSQQKELNKIKSKSIQKQSGRTSETGFQRTSDTGINNPLNKKKISLMTDKQNLRTSNKERLEKQSRFYENKKVQSQARLKFYSSSPKNNKSSALNIFDKHPHPKNLPFGLVVSHIRRKHMMTALRIGQPQTQTACEQKRINKSRFQVYGDNLRSSQNVKDRMMKSRFLEEDVTKGQNVINALRKMWDRRLLRQARESKKFKVLAKPSQNSKTGSASQKEQESRILPGVR